MFKKYQLVEILWIDSIHEAGWQKSSGVDFKEGEDQMVHKSVGYVMHESKKSIAVCQSYGLNRKDPTVDAIMQIPKGCISKVKKL